MEPPDADVYFGKVLRDNVKGARLSRAQAPKALFMFLELRHKVEIHQMTGWIVECPIDEMNPPRGRQQARLRIPPTAEQVERLFAGWRDELEAEDSVATIFGRQSTSKRHIRQGAVNPTRCVP